MSGLLPRIVAAALAPGGLVFGASSALAAAALATRPLSDHLGFELAAAMALLSGALGGLTGLSAAREERGYGGARGRDGARAAAGAAIANALWLAPPVALILLNGFRRPACDNAGGALLVLALALPSALLAGALGTLCGALFERRRWAFGLYYALLLASLAHSLWPLFGAPQAFAYDHLLGWFPGPLYDEVVSVEGPLLRFRGLTLAWTFAAIAAAGLAPGGASGPRLPRALLLGASLAVAAWGHARREAWGFESSSAFVAERLGGRIETEHFVIHYPREKSDEESRLLAQDHDLRLAQVARFLGGIATKEKIQSYVHRSAAEKRALTGAADVSFAKPWRREIHVVDAGFPHPVLGHELAHVLAGDFAPGPLRVPARAWVWVNMGLVEGLAVAAAPPLDELLLHQWARALRDLNLAPDLEELLGPAGFFAAAPERAYTFAGSFIAWLAEHRGANAVRKAYASGDLAQAGAPLGELIREHSVFLDGIVLGPEARTVAERRFRRPSIFHRTCAREIQKMGAAADEALRRGDAEGAEALRKRCAELEPDDPAHLVSLARVLWKRGRHADARDAAARALAYPKAGPSLQASTRALLGDWAWEQGALDEARTQFEAALELRPGAAAERSARVKLEALADPLASTMARPLLTSAGAADVNLLLLRELVAERPQGATWQYLLGRQLYNRGAFAHALAYLDEAARLDLTDRGLALECARLQAVARVRTGRCDAGKEALARVRELGAAADAAWADDWVERCTVQKATGEK